MTNISNQQLQAYYENLRRNQVYRAYAAGIGQNTPKPEPTFYNIKFTTNYRNPDVVDNISVYTETQVYDDIKINGDGKDILSGSTISYHIKIVDGLHTPRIYKINGQDVDVKLSYESQSFSLSGDMIVSVELNI